MVKENVDTIAAIATPPGRGGIGIIRVSGSRCKEIAKAFFKQSLKPRIAYYGSFYDENDKVIDKGIALFFPAPHSFTGEDVLEFHGHGGSVVLDCLLKKILQFDIRLARPGEFSERAFLNDKIDLTQAEAIADLIDASSEQAAHLAVRSLQGGFSKCIHELVEAITHLRMFIEASIDFSDEEIDFSDDEKILAELEQVISQVSQVQLSAKQGALMREGMTVVIAGRPNAGKSSLLNCLSGKASAIVTEIAGTTRDVLRETINVDGMPLHIVDTAGLQESENLIEQEGIRRAWKEIQAADAVLLIVDSYTTKAIDPKQILPDFFEKLPLKKSVTIIKNKIDLTGEAPHIEFKDTHPIIYLSAKNCLGLDHLKTHLKETMGFNANIEGQFLARRRHLDALTRAEKFLLAGKKQFEKNHALELLADDLHQAQNALSEITGEFTSDDLLGKIFSSFCIGK